MNASELSLLLEKFRGEALRMNSQRLLRLQSQIGSTTAAFNETRDRRRGRLNTQVLATLAAHESAASERQLREAALSPALNCWDILNLTDSEADHSLVLAWLLNRRGSHAQSGAFFRQLLMDNQELIPLPPACADEPYRLATEVRHAHSRIDIEVIGASFIVHIECKVNAAEGREQTCRERQDLKAKANRLGIPPDRTCGLFLTIAGDQCTDKEIFRPITWMDIARAVTRAAAALSVTHPLNQHLPWVLDSYAEVVRRHVLRVQTLAVHAEEAP